MLHLSTLNMENVLNLLLTAKLGQITEHLNCIASTKNELLHFPSIAGFAVSAHKMQITNYTMRETYYNWTFHLNATSRWFDVIYIRIRLHKIYPRHDDILPFRIPNALLQLQSIK